MVRLSFFIPICLALAGCCDKSNNVILVQNNELLVYVNYNEFTEYEFPFSSFTNYQAFPDFSFDAEKQKNKILITGDDSTLIIKITDDFRKVYYKNDFEYLYYESENEYSSDIETKKNLYFCGKISVNDSINSFLVLIEEPDMYYDISGSVSRILYVLNYKNHQLTSIIMLSTHMAGVDTEITIITYLIDMHFSQINYSFTDYCMYQSIEGYIPIEEIGDYVKIKKDLKVLYLSLFVIDENGFVKPINI